VKDYLQRSGFTATLKLINDTAPVEDAKKRMVSFCEEGVARDERNNSILSTPNTDLLMNPDSQSQTFL
jgi:hypothetical protein